MRVSHWEIRLAEYIEAKRSEPFAWGKNDCMTFAAGAVLVLTGADVLAPLRGRYATAIGAARWAKRLQKKHGEISWVEGISGYLPQISPRYPPRGSIIAVEHPGFVTGFAFGVVTDAKAAFVHQDGLRFLEARGLCAWGVG